MIHFQSFQNIEEQQTVPLFASDKDAQKTYIFNMFRTRFLLVLIDILEVEHLLAKWIRMTQNSPKAALADASRKSENVRI